MKRTGQHLRRRNARATSLLNDANSMKYPGTLLNQLNLNNKHIRHLRIHIYAAPHWFPVYQSHFPMIKETLASCFLHRSTVVPDQAASMRGPQLSRYDAGTAGPLGKNKRGGRYAAISPSSAQGAVHVRMCNTYLLVLASAFTRGGLRRHHQLI